MRVCPRTNINMAAHTAVATRREQAMISSVKATDRNHAVLLGIKDFLPKMVKLVSVRNKLPISRWADELMARLPGAHVSLTS